MRLALLTAILMYASPYIESWFNLESVRNWMFQTFSQSALGGANARYDVKLVEIRDDDFWSTAMGHRSPTSRTYLADIVKVLDSKDVEADVIALDFDFRLPNPRQRIRLGGYEINDPYEAETRTLVNAIVTAADHNRTVVLARTLGTHYEGANGLEPDGYLPYGLCIRDAQGHITNPGTDEIVVSGRAARHITCGYVGLPKNNLEVPLAIPVHPSGTLDSFALAIVRVKAPTLATGLDGERRYATYLSEKEIRSSGLVVSAHDLLMHDPKALEAVRRAIVIIGGGWHTWAKDRGPMVDTHHTPTGEVTGAFLHANFVQAILSQRLSRPVGDPIIELAEFLFCFLAGVVLAAPWRWWRKSLILCGFIAFFFAAQWVALFLAGAFFEAFVPFMGILIHAASHRLLHHEPAHSATVGAGGASP